MKDKLGVFLKIKEREEGGGRRVEVTGNIMRRVNSREWLSRIFLCLIERLKEKLAVIIATTVDPFTSGVFGLTLFVQRRYPILTTLPDISGRTQERRIISNATREDAGMHHRLRGN